MRLRAHQLNRELLEFHKEKTKQIQWNKERKIL